VNPTPGSQQDRHLRAPIGFPPCLPRAGGSDCPPRYLRHSHRSQQIKLSRKLSWAKASSLPKPTHHRACRFPRSYPCAQRPDWFPIAGDRKAPNGAISFNAGRLALCDYNGRRAEEPGQQARLSTDLCSATPSADRSVRVSQILCGSGFDLSPLFGLSAEAILTLPRCLVSPPLCSIPLPTLAPRLLNAPL